MLKKKGYKISTKEASSLVSIIFSRLDPEAKNKLLNLIDRFVLEELKIPKEDVPWLNPKKNKIEDYCHVLDLMRLSYAKLFSNAEKDFIEKIH